MKRIGLTLFFAVLVVSAWGQDKTTIDLSKYNLTTEDIRLVEQAINEIRELAYFRGQVDAKHGDWKIKPVPETGAYQWNNENNIFSKDELQFFKRFEPEFKFRAKNTDRSNVDSRALFPRAEKTTASQNTGYGLEGRHLIGNLPRPDYPVNESGVVVVEITVDKDGCVTQASYRSQGSTTANTELINAAIRAAKKARFNSSDKDGQIGTITYNFRLH